MNNKTIEKPGLSLRLERIWRWDRKVKGLDGRISAEFLAIIKENGWTAEEAERKIGEYIKKRDQETILLLRRKYERIPGDLK
jgi:hypothetical protein